MNDDVLVERVRNKSKILSRGFISHSLNKKTSSINFWSGSNSEAIHHGMLNSLWVNISTDTVSKPSFIQISEDMNFLC